MKLTSILSLALASLATSLPTDLSTNPASDDTMTIADTYIGAVYTSTIQNTKKDHVTDLVVNGGCVNFRINGVTAAFRQGYRCRFFR
jgi:hypothetical protein